MQAFISDQMENAILQDTPRQENAEHREMDTLNAVVRVYIYT